MALILGNILYVPRFNYGPGGYGAMGDRVFLILQ